ncbi:MAG TPA: DUF3037 domain-containing protein [Ktedonobacterales bacterium]|nr:DUF3037 domain-containing protein [Ktedonobacterales bacterium]
MPARSSFDYAVVRAVPHVERGEFLNAGVILLCREQGFLAARVALDPARLRALAPDVDAATLGELRAHVEVIPRIAVGDPQAGPIARMAQAERFHWLTAPRSTMVQVSEVHSGLCDDPAAALDHLFTVLVAAPPKKRHRTPPAARTSDA